MQKDLSRAELAAAVVRFIERSQNDSWSDTHDAEFNELALAVFRFQIASVPIYKALCANRGIDPARVIEWGQIPPLPAVSFKLADVTCLPEAERTHVFHSSGTTGQQTSRHFHNAESLTVYEASLRPSFKHHLVPAGRSDIQDLSFLSLTPASDLAPHSSLVHMLCYVGRSFPWATTDFAGMVSADGWTVDFARAERVLAEAVRRDRPVILVGTAFSFVHLLDYLASNGNRYSLPHGSRIMETGGYKGRSRELTRDELHALICDRLGVEDSEIICEYGMSELGSQAYDRIAGLAAPRRFRFPPWARFRLISPETGRTADPGAPGLISIIDLANTHSCLAVQTQDIAVATGATFQFLGRQPQADPRGCSLMPTSTDSIS